MIERQEADRSRKCLLWEASEKLRGRLREASDGRRSQRAKRETALCDDRRHYDVDRGYRSHRRRRIDDNRRVATTAAPLTERRIATVANAWLAMGIALATISLENGSPWLAAKRRQRAYLGTSYRKKRCQQRLTVMRDARSHHATTNQIFFIALQGREQLAAIAIHDC
jgi:hypothetical protein